MLKITQEIIAQHDNQDIIAYTMKAENEFSVTILNYGGIIWEINAPDKDGKYVNAVVQHAKFDPQNPGHLGAITGRIAGRVSNAKFSLNETEYALTANNHEHTLHGGINALDKKIWCVRILENGLELSYFSPHLENGFPGNVNFTVRYLINHESQLTIEALATTDMDTPINLTNHSYFNLTGERGCGGRQQLKLNSDYYGEIDSKVAFQNKLALVENTPFDFRQAKAIDQDLHDKHEQIRFGNGYDHPFILNQSENWQIELSDPISKRSLKVMTSEPVVVIYSANHFETPGSAVCLETQRMPDAINLLKYRDSVLCNPHKPYYSKTVWQFGVIQ